MWLVGLPGQGDESGSGRAIKFGNTILLFDGKPLTLDQVANEVALKVMPVYR